MTDSARDHAPSTSAATEKEPLPPWAGHEGKCAMARAATCAVGIECEHGYDVCPICDRCTCGPFQPRVEPWMRECFGDVIPFDRVERGDRLLEEVFELLQSGGYDPARVLALRDYVWGREVGDPPQELGGVMVTLAAYSLAFKMDMHAAGETELARIWTKVPQIRAKQAAKPTGSALPIAPVEASPLPTEGEGSRDEPYQEAERAGGWRPIESAPRDGKRVDLWAAERERYANERIVNCRWHAFRWEHHRTIYDDETDDDMVEVFNATHWRPLPTPPNSGEEGLEGVSVSVAESGGTAQAPKSDSDGGH